ncbi:MAG: hypothetical protein KDE51_26510, partial [Anaerolineales bacterium]|nr:hypothetical protein [Anaerolineales bacterium]
MIRLKTLMILQAIGLAVAGLGTLFFPRQYMGAFGVNLESNALTLAHIYGATALMIAVVVWLAKDAAASDGRRAILIGCLVGNVLAALVALFDI